MLNKAEARAARLRAQPPKAASMLVTHYQARRVVLFGSLANGTHDEQSDVDLAVEGLPSAVYFQPRFPPRLRVKDGCYMPHDPARVAGKNGSQ